MKHLSEHLSLLFQFPRLYLQSNDNLHKMSMFHDPRQHIVWKFKISRCINCSNCIIFLMIKKWKKAVNNKMVFRVILTDLFKAFDCICHDHLVAKLLACGLRFPALKLMQHYLANRDQRTSLVCAITLWRKFSVVSHKVQY